MRVKIVDVKNSDSLLNILANSMKDLSHKKIKSYIKYRMVEVNNRVVTNSSRLINGGSVVRVYFDARVIPEYNLDIIYEDKDIVVINKPAGLLSISNNKEKEMTAFRLVSTYIKNKNKNSKLFVVHRLDQGTSGVLLFSKNLQLKEKLQSQWNEIVKKREYIAVVEGKVKDEETIESYLTMNKAQIVHSTKNKENAWYAVTHYKLLKYKDNLSLIEVNIDTGRRNQIRVHMSEKEHPVIGDKKYGSTRNDIGRLALHASKLHLIDPRTNKILKLEAETPKEIIKLIK